MNPVVFKWVDVDVIIDGETGEVARTKAMVPTKRYRRTATQQFHDGEEYPLTIVQARSRAAHNRYFAALHEAFVNVREDIAARWPTEEHFRAWLLIETKWCVEKEIDCVNERHAMLLAKHCRSESPFARIKITESPTTGKKTLVFIWVPMSQDHSSMDKETFKKSSDDVLDLAAHFSRTNRTELLKNAGRSA